MFFTQKNLCLFLSAERCRFTWQLAFCGFAIGVVILLGGCAPAKKYDPDKKYAPQALQEDLAVLRRTYERCHPSLYWYTPKGEMDAAFDELRGSLADSLTGQQFRNRLSKTVALIHCGHTALSTAPGRKKSFPPKPVFPLLLKLWGGDSMVVVANAHRQNSLLTRGTIITAINGKTTRDLTDSLSAFISSDGWGRNFQYQVLSNNFPAWYKAVYGLSNQYTISYMDSAGRPAETVLGNYQPLDPDSVKKARQADTVSAKAKKTEPAMKPARHERERRLIIDSGRSLAIMELNTFSGAHLPRFFKHSFKTMANLQIKNLVVELRENGGGNINNNIRLTRYLIDRPFKVADTMAAKSLKYPYPLKVKNGVFFQLQRLLVARRQSDGRLHYRHFERHVYAPKEQHHFNGKIFIITGGLTFSASTLFISPLLGQPNVLTLGEETGGGAYGNTAVNNPRFTLPNTRIRASLPLYRVVFNNDPGQKGSGIIPMLPVPPTSWHLKHRIDPKMMAVYKLIGSSN